MDPVAPQVQVRFRPGTEGDVDDIAHLFDMSNGGYIVDLWGQEAGEGQTWLDVARQKILAPRSEIGPSRTIIAEATVGGGEPQVAGMLLWRLIPDTAPDLSLESQATRPFAELKALVPGSFYLSNMGVYPQWRAFGIASNMLNIAIATAYKMEFGVVCAIVHETNTKLLAHYARRGMEVVAKAAAGPASPFDPESQWLLHICRKPHGLLSPVTEKSDTDGQ